MENGFRWYMRKVWPRKSAIPEIPHFVPVTRRALADAGPLQSVAGRHHDGCTVCGYPPKTHGPRSFIGDQQHEDEPNICPNEWHAQVQGLGASCPELFGNP